LERHIRMVRERRRQAHFERQGTYRLLKVYAEFHD
jgi:hypothetical protein